MKRSFIFLLMAAALTLPSITLATDNAAPSANLIVENPQDLDGLGANPSADFEANAEVKARLKSGDVRQTMGGRLRGAFGCVMMLLFAIMISTNRKRINWRTVGYGLGIQFIFAVIALKLPAGQLFFDLANDVVLKILSFSTEGARFLFGNLVGMNVPVGSPGEGPAHMVFLDPNGSWANTGAFFAFNVLPTIIFFSALTTVLYHLRVLEWIIRLVAMVMEKTMKTSGAESFSAAANIFVGQTEAPLLVKPFIAKMTNSELLAIMSGGMATVAGGVLAAYVGILKGYFPDIAGHLIAASVMSAPAALVMSKIIFPETKQSETAKASDIKVERSDANVIDAAARGTSEGLMLALNVGAMLIAFIALIAFMNWVIGGILGIFGFPGLTLEIIFSWLGAPIAYIMGVPWADAPFVGSLIGTKTVINEMVAYIQLSDELTTGQITHAKSVIIATYALCGFSNFSSIGIQLGGLSAMAPQRRKDFAKLGIRAMIAGSLACFQTAAIAGILL